MPRKGERLQDCFIKVIENKNYWGKFELTFMSFSTYIIYITRTYRNVISKHIFVQRHCLGWELELNVHAHPSPLIPGNAKHGPGKLLCACLPARRKFPGIRIYSSTTPHTLVPQKGQWAVHPIEPFAGIILHFNPACSNQNWLCCFVAVGLFFPFPVNRQPFYTKYMRIKTGEQDSAICTLYQTLQWEHIFFQQPFWICLFRLILLVSYY